MADEITLTGTFEDIADAIREKGISGTMKATDMPGKIRQIAQLDPEDYYTKSETSSAAELSDAFANVSANLSDFVTESDISDFVDAQQVADQIALNEDGFVQGKADGQAIDAARTALQVDNDTLDLMASQGELTSDTIYFPGPVDDDTGGVKPFVAASRSWVDNQGYLKSGDLTAYYDKTETSSAAEISSAIGRVEAATLSAISDAGEALQKAEKVQTTLDSDFKLTELSGEYDGGGTFRKFFWTYEPHWFTMKNVGSSNATARLDNVGNTLEYSLDGGSTWTAYTNASDVTVGAGSEIKFRNNGVDTLTPSRVQAKYSQGSWNVYGNIMTLLDQTGMLKSLTGTQHAFEGMFGQTAVIDASKLELPATTLGTDCYHDMFFGCTSLTAGPAELPATTLVNACYLSMFYGCRALTNGPAVLPATTIPEQCYFQMFKNCSSLTKAPYLAATSAPNWSACSDMFNGCSALAEVEVALTQWYTQDNFANWLNGVAAQGVFKCPTALGTNETIARSVSRCPENWTVINV